MEMTEEWRSSSSDERRSQLLLLVRDIVRHNMSHNAEVEACDLLTEIERLDLLLEYVEEADHGRVCLYLLRCGPCFLLILRLFA
jgi:26S proteasome regulatory subunit N1